MADTSAYPRAHRTRAREILARLEAIDLSSVRPARAVAIGAATQRDLGCAAGIGDGGCGAKSLSHTQSLVVH